MTISCGISLKATPDGAGCCQPTSAVKGSVARAGCVLRHVQYEKAASTRGSMVEDMVPVGLMLWGNDDQHQANPPPSNNLSTTDRGKADLGFRGLLNAIDNPLSFLRRVQDSPKFPSPWQIHTVAAQDYTWTNT